MKILAQYTELTPYQTQEQWNLVEVRGEEWVTQHRVNQLHTWSIEETELMYPGILKVLREIYELDEWSKEMGKIMSQEDFEREVGR